MWRAFLRPIGLPFVALSLLLGTDQSTTVALTTTKRCSDFHTWQEAQSYFLSAGTAASHLDGNHNGIACESLPGSPTQAGSSAPRSAAATPSPTATATPPQPTPTATPTPFPTMRPAATVRVPVLDRTPPPAARNRDAPSDLAADADGYPSSSPPQDASAGRSETPTPAVEALPSVWVLALAPTDLTGAEGEVMSTLAAGDRVRVLAVGDGAILVAFPGDVGSGWVRVDPRIQFVAQ